MPAAGVCSGAAPGWNTAGVGRSCVERATRRTLDVEQPMTQKVEAIYTDGVLKPTRELSLKDNQRVRLTVETIDEPEQGSRGRDRAPEGRHRKHAFFLGGAASQPRGTA